MTSRPHDLSPKLTNKKVGEDPLDETWRGVESGFRHGPFPPVVSGALGGGLSTTRSERDSF